MTRRRKILITLLLIIVIGGVAGPATFSAFSSTTANNGNVFTAGTVHIDDNDDGGSTALLALANAKPGDSDSGCIRVNYTGTLEASVPALRERVRLASAEPERDRHPRHGSNSEHRLLPDVRA